MTAEPPAVPHILHLDRDGRIFMDREEVPAREFPDRLRQAMQGSCASVYFAAAGDLPHETVLDFLDLCRNSGARNLALVLEDLPSVSRL